MSYKIALFRPNIHQIGGKLLERALNGEQEILTRELEKAVCDQIGAPHAVAAMNPASAIHLALCALDIKRGDKIVCSVNAHPALPQMVRHFDAEPIFVDINPESFNINLDALQNTLAQNPSKKLRGVIVPFLAGQVPALKRLYSIAREHGAFVLEDASGSYGITHEGQKVGTMEADITLLSLSPLDSPAAANVGFLLTPERELADRARLLRSHGIDYHANPSVEYAYDVLEIGLDYRPSGLDVAATIDELTQSEKLLKRRQSIAARYREAFEGVPHISNPAAISEHAYWAYIIKVDKNRDGFAKNLAERGIQTGLHYMPLHMMSYYRNKYGLRITSFPKALNNYQQILSLPIYADMSDTEVQMVIDAVTEIARARVW
jgi:dTDP-4-amino-4,6-dideoxygalactose transaminase